MPINNPPTFGSISNGLITFDGETLFMGPNQTWEVFTNIGNTSSGPGIYCNSLGCSAQFYCSGVANFGDNINQVDNTGIVQIAAAVFHLENLPTADPHVNGHFWTNSNVMTKSTG